MSMYTSFIETNTLLWWNGIGSLGGRSPVNLNPVPNKSWFRKGHDPCRAKSRFKNFTFLEGKCPQIILQKRPQRSSCGYGSFLPPWLSDFRAPQCASERVARLRHRLAVHFSCWGYTLSGWHFHVYVTECIVNWEWKNSLWKKRKINICSNI